MQAPQATQAQSRERGGVCRPLSGAAHDWLYRGTTSIKSEKRTRVR